VKRVPVLSTFNAGELSPSMYGRIELDKYSAGAQTIENMVVTLQGPLLRRGGTVFVAPADPNGAWLPKFYFDRDQAYALEMSPGAMRFFTQRGLLEASPGVPLVIAHSYDEEADLTTEELLFRPSYAQSGDVVFFANGRQVPKVLSRLGAIDWTWTDFEPYNGPFKEENDTDVSMWLEAVVQFGQTTNLHASSNIFLFGHIGSLIELRAVNVDTPAWKSGEAIADSGLARYWDGRYYLSAGTGTTGTLAPTHAEGTLSDGGVLWRFSHAGRVTVKVTARPGPAVCQVVMQTDPVGEVVSQDKATRFWSFGAWSDVDGWPEQVAFFRDRLVFARGRTLWASSIGDYTNFSARTGGEILPENAITARVAVGRAEEIKWLHGDDELLIGTEGGIMILREQTQQQVLGPGNVTVVPGPAVGCAAIPPVVSPSGQLLFVDKTRTQIRHITFSAESDSYTAPILTRMADHALLGQVVQFQFMTAPHELLWCMLSDGQFGTLTFDPQDGVFAWHRHGIAGVDAVVEAICILPSPDVAPGLPRDDLWLLVSRKVEGEPTRHIEFLEEPFRGPPRAIGETRTQFHARVSEAAHSAVYADSATVYDAGEGDTLSVAPGLQHLEGLEVAILADGTPYPRKTVEDGQVPIDPPARRVCVGLPYKHRLVTMSPETGAAAGTSQGRVKRVNRLDIRVWASLGGRAGTSEEDLNLVEALHPYRAAETPMGEATPLFFGDAELPAPGGYDREGVIVIEGDEPLPFNLIALIPHVEIE
jgi:hypothetical protein